MASTLSTCYCCISAAIGALFGSLHGGANEKVIAMVESIGSRENVRDYVNRAIDKHRKIMGMGYRVYRAQDPRSKIMEEYLETLSRKKNNLKNYEILEEVRKVFRERMEEKG